jgi:hypothetical protein
MGLQRTVAASARMSPLGRLARSPSPPGMSAICAFRPAGVDVKRSLQIGTIHTLDAGPLEVQALYCLVGPLK